MKIFVEWTLTILSVACCCEGYLILIRSHNSSKSGCITNDPSVAMAPVLDLATDVTASLQHWNNANRENLMELDCVPGFSHGSWIVSGLRSAETRNLKNLYDSLEMNLLRKWNYFPVFVTDGSANFLSPPVVVENAIGMRALFRFSILAKQSTQILLTGNESWLDSPGVIINIDTHSNPGICWLQMCKQVINTFHYSGCEPRKNLFNVKSSPEVINQWVHVEIEVKLKLTSNEKHINSISLKLQTDHEEVKGDLKIESSIKVLLKYVTVRSINSRAVFKLHDYKYLTATEDQKITANWNSSMENDTLPAMYISHMAEDTLTKYSMQLSAVSKKRKILSSINGTYAHTSDWKIDATQQQMELPNGQFQISLTFSALTNIDSIFIAPPQDRTEIVTPSKLVACQIMKPTIITSNEPKIYSSKIIQDGAPAIFGNPGLCAKLGQDNCFNVEACTPIGCFCYSGYKRNTATKMCTKPCEFPLYGPDCTLTASKECDQRFYSRHTGCTKCKANKRPPHCNTTLSHFHLKPVVQSVGHHSVIISTSEALKNLTDEDKKHFVRGELQLKKVGLDGVISKQPVALNQVNPIGFENLDDNIAYVAKLVLFEAGDLSDLDRSPGQLFKTNTCQSLDHKNVRVLQENGKLKITQSGDGKVCRITSFSVSFANGTVASKETHKVAISKPLELYGLPKYFNYVIKFYRNDKEMPSIGFEFNITRTEEIRDFLIIV